MCGARAREIGLAHEVAEPEALDTKVQEVVDALLAGGPFDRLTVPLLRQRQRENGELRPASWPEAVAFLAERLRAIVARHGPEAVGVLGSARSTNEENYIAQKFARVVLGTNNVDCCARVCHAPSARAISAMHSITR